MNDTFLPGEKLYRAIYPPEIAPIYWKQDGSISYRAFADPRGLSVDRGDYRDDDAVARDMQSRLTGRIIMWYVKICNEVGAVVKYRPSANNPYHSEVHGSRDTVLLSKHQCFYLAQKVRII